MNLLLFYIFFLGTAFQTTYASDCEVHTELQGILFSQVDGSVIQRQMCWTIHVPDHKYVSIVLRKLEHNAVKPHVTITGLDPEVILDAGDIGRVVTAFDDINVNVIANGRYTYPSWNFESFYMIEDLACLDNSNFRCSPHSCVSQSLVCDGIEDCDDGTDEQNCKTSIRRLRGTNKSLSAAISWLKKERMALGIWRKNAERAITALYLADGVEFKKSCSEDEMLARELELKTSVTLLRNGTDPVTASQLGMFVNALLVSCHEPRNFYGFDLVRILKEHVEEGVSDFEHPLAMLALCNANQSLSHKSVRRLGEILRSDASHSFLLDVQAVALMALSCIKNSGRFPEVESFENSTITQFIELQRPDGSFGNIYTTAIVTQALLGSGQEDNPQWRVGETVKFLLNKQTRDSSFGDFLATYLILPILNSKSLVEISKIDCSTNRKKPRDADPVSDIESRLGAKMRVKYSLYIGDELDVAHTISLRVPHNVTVYEVMQIAAVADHKYKFESILTGKMLHVFSIDGIVNDPESGKFWMLYLNNGTSAPILNESPDEIAVKNGEYLVMWYRTPVDITTKDDVAPLVETEDDTDSETT